MINVHMVLGSYQRAYGIGLISFGNVHMVLGSYQRAYGIGLISFGNVHMVLGSYPSATSHLKTLKVFTP